MFTFFQSRRGFSLVEVLIVSAIIMLFFGGLLASVEYVLKVTANSKARLSALALAQERIEFFRSLSYDSVGTIAGIPSGTIPQNSTSTFNNIEFSERVLIQFVDDDADGLGVADTNGILADYKQVKVELSWNMTGATSSISLISNIVPRSIETTTGGGTIRVNVTDATYAPLPGASVRVINNTTTSTIDVTRLTDAKGVALIAGAPAASDYQIFVSKPGYTGDQTYAATTSNSNPLTAPFSVLESDISTMNFQIDRVADLQLRTYSSISEVTESETFATSTGIATSTGVVVDSGVLRLEGASTGPFPAEGVAYLNEIVPSTLSRFEVLVLDLSVGSGTQILTRLYTGTSSAYVLVPDSDLPGNAAGFSGSLIDLRGLDVGTYPTLTIGLHLSTTNPMWSPSVDEISLWYRSLAVARPSTPFTLRGDKVIGAGPVYKNIFVGSTDVGGQVTYTDIEWDTYSGLTLGSGLVATEVCPGTPVNVSPDANLVVDVTAIVASTNNLRIQVIDGSGLAVPGAVAELTRPMLSLTEVTGACGQAFYNSLANEADFNISVTATGYANNVQSLFAVSGDTVLTITLTP